MKNVTVTFDFEGTWGMPHKAAYDLVSTTGKLLETLSKHGAKAVFFVAGKLVEEYPEVIKSIADAGHEVGIHGYTHEHMHDLNLVGLEALEKQLSQTSKKVESLTGIRPVGFRAPYLMGPKFYDPKVYEMLARVGFTWASNREIRQPAELSRPDRLPGTRGLWKIRPVRSLALLALNARLVMTERPDGGLKVISGIRWLLGGQAPFDRKEGLTEYPLYSPLDCDLLEFPKPESDSGNDMTSFASGVMKDCYDNSAQNFNLNCHDWIIGTSDRIQVLDQVLGYISKSGKAVYTLPGHSGGAK